MFNKVTDFIKEKSETLGGRSAKGNIVAALLILLIIFLFYVWFLCACYNWTVLAFPSFTAFPKFAYVVLMLCLTSGSRSSS